MVAKKQKEKEKVYEVERVVSKEIRNGKVYYFLKWVGYSNRHNSWEPEDNCNCDDLIDQFEANRAKAVLAVERRNNELFYVVLCHDTSELLVFTRMEARIWSKLVLEFLMEKVKYDGFFRNANDNTELIVLPNIPRAQQPEIVYVTDFPGDTIFCLKYADGHIFANYDEVKTNFAAAAIEYLENHLNFD